MNPFEIIGGVLLLLSGVFIIAVVMLQESKQANGGMNAITGAATDNYFGKNAGKTKDAMLAKVTKVLAVAIFVLTIVMNLLVRYL